MSEDFKTGVVRKYNEFQRSGLTSYLRYLKKEAKNAEGKEIKKHYYKYILKEIENADKKIAKLNELLS